MPGSGGLNDAEVAAARESGRLSDEALDRMAGRVLDLIRRGAEALAEPVEVDDDAHHRLARRAAAETAVLLTNDGLLPLDPATSVAVIGGFATEPRYQGAGSSLVDADPARRRPRRSARVAWATATWCATPRATRPHPTTFAPT